MHYRQLLRAIAQAHTSSVGRAAAAVNQGLVLRNWLVGAYVVEFEQGGEDRAKYGDGLLKQLARDLAKRDVSGCSPDMLERMRQFYATYPQLADSISSSSMRIAGRTSANPVFSISASPMRKSKKSQAPAGFLSETKVASTAESVLGPISASLMRKSSKRQSLTGELSHDPISETPSTELKGAASKEAFPTPLKPQQLLQFSWTHLIELLRLDDPWKRAFYENECILGGWSVRQLQRQIGSLLYERTGLSKNKRAVVARARKQSADAPATIEDLIRDPYVLEFAGLADRPAYSENDLETALLNHVQGFLLELGTGFCFEARQFRITVGNEHDRVDLVFYHRRLRCHVLLDLKIRAFSHGDAGQMNFYLNYFKKHMMAEGDQPPVGILLCSDKEKTKVEYATAGLSQKLFVSRYLVALPSAEQLRKFVEADRARIEQG